MNRTISPGCLWLVILAGVGMAAGVRAGEATGSGLDDAGLEAAREVDPRGLSALTPVRRRSPSGILYPFPYRPPAWTNLGGLDYRGSIEAGYLANNDRDRETRFEEHVDWSDGLLVRDFALDLRSAAGSGYASFEGGSAGRDDAFYRAELGRRGWVRLGLFFDAVEHVQANDARSLFRGVGTGSLTLPAPLVPGASTPADVDAALAGIGERQLEIERDRAGLNLSLRASSALSLSGHYRRERRRGERPFGGGIFFSFLNPNLGSVIETVEPIDSLTHDFGAGVQYAGPRVQANLRYRGSSFENDWKSLTWENPFNLPGIAVPRGRAALAPDNLAHGVHGDLALVLPLRGRWTASAAYNRMRQTEDLIPGTINPLYPDWTGAAGLARSDADARVDTWLFDTALRLRPLASLTARVHLRYFERDNRTDYVAFNPLANDYGYVAEDGRFGVIPRYAPVPFDHERWLAEASGIWRTPFGTSLELEYAREEVRRSNRARDTSENTLRASLASRRIGPASLRVAYEYRDRRGSGYDVAHDGLYYSDGPPGFAAPAIGTPLQSLREFRQADLANRSQHELQARLYLGLGRAVDLSLAASARNADYDSDYGRDFERGRELNLELGYQPSPALELHTFGSAERRGSRLRSIDSIGAPVPPFNAGSAVFPLANRWAATSWASTLSAGAGFRWRPLARLELSGDYTWLRSRDRLDYRYASDDALAAGTTAADAGRALPTLLTSDEVLRLASEFKLDEHWSARVFYRLEHSRLGDPQQEGITPRIRRNLYLGHVDDDFRASLWGAALFLEF